MLAATGPARGPGHLHCGPETATMPLTPYQRRVCRLLAAERVTHGERYVAGGAALNEILAAPRVSHDVDLFHDTAEAVLASWETDRQVLLAGDRLVFHEGVIRGAWPRLRPGA